MAAVLAAGGRFDPQGDGRQLHCRHARSPSNLVPPLARKLSKDAAHDLRLCRRGGATSKPPWPTARRAAIDVALPMSDSVRRAKVAADGFVVAGAQEPSCPRRRSPLAAYLRLEHVMCRRAAAARAGDLRLGQLATIAVRLRCRNYGAAFRIVQETDFLLTMPARYAGLLNERAGHRLLKLPFAMPTLDLYLYWHEAAHDDPANRWLRAQLLEVLGKSTSVSKTA